MFDFDGTLADTTQGIVSTARQVLSEYGMSEAEMGDLRRLIGPPFPAGYTMVYGIPPEDARRLTDRYHQIYDERGPESHRLYPGMAELLRRLKADGRLLAVASSKQHPLVTRMLEDDGVLGLFDAVQGQTDPAHAGKPYLIGHVLELLGARPEEAVMVGDRDYDVLGAAELGVPCAAVLFGTAERAELERAGAAAVCETPAELARVLGVSGEGLG